MDGSGEHSFATNDGYGQCINDDIHMPAHPRDCFNGLYCAPRNAYADMDYDSQSYSQSPMQKSRDRPYSIVDDADSLGLVFKEKAYVHCIFLENTD